MFQIISQLELLLIIIVGTFSGVYPDSYDEKGNVILQIFKGKTREERNKELIDYSIKGSIAQAKKVYKISAGNGLLFMNNMWGLSYIEHVLNKVLEKTKRLIHGVSCGASMPFGLGDIAEKYKVYYNPIISSLRAFKIFWTK